MTVAKRQIHRIIALALTQVSTVWFHAIPPGGSTSVSEQAVNVAIFSFNDKSVYML